MYKTYLNNFISGTIIGIVAPVLTFFVIYWLKFSHLTIDVTIKYLNNTGAFTQLISLCAIPNLLLFFIFIRTNNLLSGRGIIFATFLITAAVLVLKIVY